MEGVEIIDATAAKRLEPALACVAAMHSPETGVIDSHRYMLALRGDFEDRGGQSITRMIVAALEVSKEEDFFRVSWVQPMRRSNGRSTLKRG